MHAAAVSSYGDTRVSTHEPASHGNQLYRLEHDSQEDLFSDREEEASDVAMVTGGTETAERTPDCGALYIPGPSAGEF